MITVTDFSAFIREAEPGWTLTYHTGDLAKDRAHDRALDELAAAVLAASVAGNVDLWQRRVGSQQFEYIAARRKVSPMRRAA